ncbi:hypothetical protein N9W21_06930 [Shewanella sp.]|nr:hypothetical protein [Shewanella sp.]
MRKRDKKIENAIRIALTQACEQLKDNVTGFAWLTHQVDVKHIEKTLKVTFMFTSLASLNAAKQSLETDAMIRITCDALAQQHIRLHHAAKQCHFAVDKKAPEGAF